MSLFPYHVISQIRSRDSLITFMVLKTEESPKPTHFLLKRPYLRHCLTNERISLLLVQRMTPTITNIAHKHTCPFVTEIISFEDKPANSRYSNRQKKHTFTALYFQDGCSNPTVMFSDDRSPVFLSKNNHSRAELFV